MASAQQFDAEGLEYNSASSLLLYFENCSNTDAAVTERLVRNPYPLLTSCARWFLSCACAC